MNNYFTSIFTLSQYLSYNPTLLPINVCMVAYVSPYSIIHCTLYNVPISCTLGNTVFESSAVSLIVVHTFYIKHICEVSSQNM